MAADDVGNTLMLIKGLQGPYEAQSRVDTREDKLAEDFKAGTFFEIDEFSFTVETEQKEDSANKKKDANKDRDRKLNDAIARLNAAEQRNPDARGRPMSNLKPQRGDSGSRSAFAKWIQRDGGVELRTDLEGIDISRQLDITSLRLFRAACERTEFESAQIIRRKITGAKSQLRTYLQIKLGKTMITSLSWQDGDLVRERFRLVTRSVATVYHVQSRTGEISSTDKDGGFWSHAQAAGARGSSRR